MFTRILFPLDFSEQSLRMFDCLLELEHLGTREVILLFVAAGGQQLTAEQRGLLDRLKADLHAAGIAPREVVVSGDPVKEIIRTAEKEEVTLIAMASSGKGKAQEFLVGSTSFGVLRLTRWPVLINKFKVVDRAGQKGMVPSCRLIFRRALVPIDFTSCRPIYEDLLPKLSKQGLEESVLFHVVESTKYALDDGGRFKDVLDRLEEHKARLAGQGCNVTTHVHFGTVSYNILEAARELEASLILLGAHRKTLLRELALGGNSEEVIRKSPVPLLVIPCEK